MRIARPTSFWYILSQSHKFHDDLGYGELRIVLKLPECFGRLRTGIGITSAFRYKEPQFVNYEVNAFINPFRNVGTSFHWLPTFMIQFFSGKGENLREYDRHTPSLRIGIAFL